MDPSVRRIIVTLCVVSIILGLLVAIPYFVAVMIGVVSFGHWTPYIGMVVAGIGSISGAAAFVLSLRGKSSTAALQPLAVIALAFSISGVMMSFVLRLIKG